MERGDLLTVNGGIFGPQGRAIAANAASDVRVLVVGNPCNTNCLIARSNAPEVPGDRWFAMTRLDENRAKAQLAGKAGRAGGDGHPTWPSGGTTRPPSSPTSPTPSSAASRRPRSSTTSSWLQGDFLTTVQKRGAAIIDARGPVLGGVGGQCRHRLGGEHPDRHPRRRLSPRWRWCPTASTGSPRASSSGFRCGPTASGGWTVVEGLAHDPFATERIRITTEELEAERADVADLLP